jgi:hypothetical protein
MLQGDFTAGTVNLYNKEMAPKEMLQVLTEMRGLFKKSKRREPGTVKELDGFLRSLESEAGKKREAPAKRAVLKSLEWIGR